MNSDKKWLSGLRVVDFSMASMGPMASRQLQLLGALVVKVESFFMGDPILNFAGLNPRTGVDCGAYAKLNEGKDVLKVSLRSKSDHEKIIEIIRNADVLIESFTPGRMEALGLSPETVFSINRKIVYVRITSHGQRNAYSKMLLHEQNVLAMNGVLSVLQKEENSPQLMPGAAVGFSYYLAMRIIALKYALMSGVEIDADDLVIDASLSDFSFEYALLPLSIGRPCASTMFGSDPHNSIYRCLNDTWLVISVPEPKVFRRLTRMLNIEEALNAHELKKRLSEIFASKHALDWESCLLPKGIAATALRVFHNNAPVKNV